MEYRTTLGMLTVVAVGGKEIKGRSMFSVSPYIAFQIDHMKRKTKVCKNKGKNPKWNDVVEFEIIKGRDVLNGKVMGKEISEDEFIGDIKVDLKPVFQKGYVELWTPVIHPHKNRHKGDIFLQLSYKKQEPEPDMFQPMPIPMRPPMNIPPQMPLQRQGSAPVMGSPMGGPMGAPMRGPSVNMQRPPNAIPPNQAPFVLPPNAPPIPPKQVRPHPPPPVANLGPRPVGNPGQPSPRQFNAPPLPIGDLRRQTSQNDGRRGPPPPIPIDSRPQRSGSSSKDIGNQLHSPRRMGSGDKVQTEEPKDINIPPRHSPGNRHMPSNEEIKHAMSTPNQYNNPGIQHPSRSYSSPNPQHKQPARQMSQPQNVSINTNGVSPRIQASRSPKPSSPGSNPITFPQRMMRPPQGPRPHPQ